MTEATGISCDKLAEFKDGSEMFVLRCTATAAETVTIPTTGDGASVLATTTAVQLISLNNITTGEIGGVASALYTTGSRLFTLAGVDDDSDCRIVFIASKD